MYQVLIFADPTIFWSFKKSVTPWICYQTYCWLLKDILMSSDVIYQQAWKWRAILEGHSLLAKKWVFIYFNFLR